MRILLRTSKWAIWARRLGSFALPLAVIPVFMHRQRLITSDAFAATEVVAIAIAILAVLVSLGAFARLWVTGDRGWWRAVVGATFGLICLLPEAYVAVLALRYPPVTDVSTDVADPPPLISGAESALVDPATQARIHAAFPNVLTRTYPLGVDQVFALANALAQTRGWDIRVRRAPQTALDDGQINAIATTPLGWRDEVSIRIRGAANGSAVAMRSTALTPIHDLGANGLRIEEFLTALDGEVTVMLRDAPAVAAPIPEPAPG